MSALRPLRAYLSILLRFSPRRFGWACALNLASAAFSGLSLLALIPLLHYTGWMEKGRGGGLVEGVLRRLPDLEGRPPLYVALGAFLLLIAASTGLDLARQNVANRLRLDFLFAQRSRLNAAIARARWSHLAARRLQHAHHMVTAGLSQIASLTQYSLQFVSEALLALAYLAFSLALSARFTLIVAAAAALLLALHRGMGAARAGLSHFAANRALQERLTRFLDGVKQAKSRNQADAYALHFDDAMRAEQAHQWTFLRAQGRARASMTLLSAAIFAAAFLVGASFLHLPLGPFLLLLAVYARLMPRIIAVQQAWTQAAHLAPVFAQMQEMLADYESHPEARGTGRPVEFSSELRLEGVSYVHPGGRGVRDISAAFPARTTTALVGPSGAGKTTLADLLAGLLAPQEGVLRVDGRALDEAGFADWRECVSYVPQEPFLLHGTVRENLNWGSAPARDEDLWEALRLSRAEALVLSLPEGLDTLLGDKGARLSGGERQRLILARALLLKPRMLILDEATSALDAASEESIHEALRALHGRLTVLLITHRSDPLRHVDRVLTIENGRLIDSRRRAP